MEKLIGINYEDAGNFTKFSRESEITDDWLEGINNGEADILKIEVTSTGEPLVRKLLVDEEEEEGDTALKIADWELIA